jgi:phosphorylcholine metabolism protein LicD
MAGDLKIGGVLKEKAKYVLKDIASIFNFLKIDYSLDCGTLLGVVRDGDIIAWDNDIDLCVRNSEIKN